MARANYSGIIWDYDNTTRWGFWNTGAFAVMRVVLILLNVAIVVPTYMLWLIIIWPLKWINEDLFWKIEGFMYEHVVLFVANWQWTAKYTLSTVGEDLEPLIGQCCVFTPNHQSTADIMTVISMMAWKNNITRHQTSIMDWFVKYTLFGWFLWVHGEFFIHQGNTKGEELSKFARHTQEVFVPRNRKWYFVFPEGGFLRKRKARSQAYAVKHGYPVLEHVVLPRVGILEVLLRLLSPQSAHLIKTKPYQNEAQINNYNKSCQSDHAFKYLVDITFGYPERTDLNLQTILLGTRNPCQTQVHIRKFPISEVPVESEALLQWMYKRFEEKEMLLDVFYKTGQFPEWNPTTQEVIKDNLLIPKPIRMPNARIVSVLLCFTIGFLLNWYYIWSPLIDCIF